MRYRLLMGRQALTELAQHGAFARMRSVIHQRYQRLDELKFRLERAERGLLERQRRRWDVAAAAVRHYDARRILAGIRKELDARIAELSSTMETILLRRRSRLEQLAVQLQALSPLAILDRGYALVFDSSSKLLKDARQVRTGEEIRARLASGEVRATVNRTEP